MGSVQLPLPDQVRWWVPLELMTQFGITFLARGTGVGQDFGTVTRTATFSDTTTAQPSPLPLRAGILDASGVSQDIRNTRGGVHAAGS